MLNEKVLEFLTRNSPLQESLVRLAWPSLTIECKLQVIDAIQRGHGSTTANWLMELSMSDTAAIVRYWAARYYDYRDEKSRGNWLPQLRASELELMLSTQIKNDPEPLVRACITPVDLTQSTQIQRIAYHRHYGKLSLLDWLDEAVDAGVDDEYLRDCVLEVFAQPEIRDELKKSAFDFPDGESAYFEGQLVITGWKVVKKAGSRLQKALAMRLPTARGLGTVSADELASMPKGVIEILSFRAGTSAEIDQALELIRKNPANYSAEVVSVASIDHSEGPSEEELEVNRARAAADRGQEILDVVLHLKKQVVDLALQVQGLSGAANTKRKSFFS